MRIADKIRDGKMSILNRNVFKLMNLYNIEMFPSDPSGSLDALFSNNYNIFGGFLND